MQPSGLRKRRELCGEKNNASMDKIRSGVHLWSQSVISRDKPEIHADPSSKWRMWIYECIESLMQLLGIGFRDPFSGIYPDISLIGQWRRSAQKPRSWARYKCNPIGCPWRWALNGWRTSGGKASLPADVGGRMASPPCPEAIRRITERWCKGLHGYETPMQR